MKGWLDKYSEEIPKAQKGKTITVDSKNDPRYKAYQDSLSLYNKEKKEEKEYNDFIKKNNISKKVTRQWINPVKNENKKNTKKEPIQEKEIIYKNNHQIKYLIIAFSVACGANGLWRKAM